MQNMETAASEIEDIISDLPLDFTIAPANSHRSSPIKSLFMSSDKSLHLHTTAVNSRCQAEPGSITISFKVVIIDRWYGDKGGELRARMILKAELDLIELLTIIGRGKSGRTRSSNRKADEERKQGLCTNRENMTGGWRPEVWNQNF